MPPVARHEQQFTRFEDERDRLGPGKQGESFEVGLVETIDHRDVLLRRRWIQPRLLVRRIDNELLATVDLHEERVGADAVIVKDRKGSARATDIKLYRRTTIQYVAHVSNKVALGQP